MTHETLTRAQSALRALWPHESGTPMHSNFEQVLEAVARERRSKIPQTHVSATKPLASFISAALPRTSFVPAYVQREAEERRRSIVFLKQIHRSRHRP